MNTTTLISSTDLLQCMRGDALPIVLDASFDLADTDAGARLYAESHLPGAQYIHLDRDLSASKTGRNGRHPLPSRAEFAATVGRLGITPQTCVVIYDRQGGMFAARVWWMLRWLGHEAVAVLDGGVAAWQAAGGALSSEPSETPLHRTPEGARAPWERPGGALDQPSLAPTIDADTLARRLGRAPLIDARAPPRFRGEIEPLDAQAGHIPGALNRFYQDNLCASGQFKSPAQLRAEFEPLIGMAGAAQVVHQCGSGVTACHNLLAMEYAGLTGSVLYPGSWSEWSADPARPVARG